MDNTRKKIIRWTLAFVIIISIFIFTILINEQIDENRVNSFKPIKDNEEHVYQVESLTIDESEVVIKGWFFELKSIRNKLCENVKKTKPDVILYDINTEIEKNIDGSDKMYKGKALNMEWYDRPDINKYFSCEYDYTHCGFTARIPISEIDLDNKQYQIAFKYQEENPNMWGILSTTYIDKGSLCYVSPKDIIELDITGTDLDTIVKDGICVASCPEYHICVYQKEWELYWIADEDYFFEDDNSTYIEYQLETTQYDKLPLDRINNGWFWSNIGSNFENHEITESISCGKYRVCSRKIPTDYSITRIVTGYYVDGKWIWQKCFRPLYKQ